MGETHTETLVTHHTAESVSDIGSRTELTIAHFAGGVACTIGMQEGM